MKIGFRADGSTDMGLGHVSRCSVLADKLLQKGHQVKFFCLSKHSEGIEWLIEKGYSCSVLNSNDIESEEKEICQVVVNDKIDVLFLDSYFLRDEYFKALKQKGIFTVCIDDFELYNYDCDVIVNFSFGAEQLKYSGSKYKKVLSGGKYSILRDEFLKAPISTFHENIESVLITMGGSDVNNFTPTVLKGISEIENIDITVIVGPLMTNIEEIKNVKCLGTVQILENPNNIAALMSECDLAISAAGGTLRELFAMGVVSLFITQAENQLANSNYIDSLNAPIKLHLGFYTDVDSQDINKAVRKIISDSKNRMAMRELILKLSDKKGAQNIVDEVLELYTEVMVNN